MDSRCKKLQLRILLLQLTAVCISIWGLGSVQASPIKITLDTLKNCTQGLVAGQITTCCPAPDIDLNVTVVDFIPKRDRVSPHRVRKALQCLSGEELRTYVKKLTRAYDLMRALPPSDPRSLLQQQRIHCAYGSGAFIQDGLRGDNFGIDIHSNWHFIPWHRMFTYFHERILQGLLNDPTFSLHFWNFDNTLDGTKSYEGVQGKGQGCFKPGHFFPDIYNDPSTSTFEPQRAARTLVPGITVDLTIIAGVPQTDIPLRFANDSVPGNRAAMHVAMEKGTTPRDFLGIPYKYGDVRNFALSGGGSLEFQPHNSMHRWVAGIMRLPSTATADPIFYPVHANVERLWDVWMKTGDNRRLQPNDPDWLDAEFLFWDEKQILRRAKVRDFLSISDLGYSFEKVNDASWMSWENSTSTAPITPAMEPMPHS